MILETVDVSQRVRELLGFVGLAWLLAAVATPVGCVWIACRYRKSVERIMFGQGRSGSQAAGRSGREAGSQSGSRSGGAIHAGIGAGGTGPGMAAVDEHAQDASSRNSATPMPRAGGPDDIDVLAFGGEESHGGTDSPRLRRMVLVVAAASVAHAAFAAVVLARLAGQPIGGPYTYVLAGLLATSVWPAMARVAGGHGSALVWTVVHAAVVAAIVAVLRIEDAATVVAILFLAFCLPPTVPTWFAEHRSFRATAPFVWLLSLTVPAVAIGPFVLSALDPLPRLSRLGLAVVLVGAIGVTAWLATALVISAERRRRLGVLSLSLHVHWLVYTAWYGVIGVAILSVRSSSPGSPWEAGWVLASSAASALVLHAGLPWVRRGGVERTRQLLLLRVFGHRRRSEMLLEAVGSRWRWAGAINLLAGPDLAASTLDLPELLDFAGGRLDTHFIADVDDDLRRRVAAIDVDADPDGRFRVNELFCLSHTWRAAMTALAGRADVVLMDLRGFGARHEGCRYELEALVAQVDRGGIVLLVDSATDMAVLRSSLASAVDRSQPRSPSRNEPSGRIRCVHADGGGRRRIRRLMAALAAAG